MPKQKFKSAEHKAQMLALQQSWEDLKQKHATRPARAPRLGPKRVLNPRVEEIRQLPSLDTGVKGNITPATAPKVYTGDKMIGIATMHKSNMVPIFNSESAQDVSKMRR